jgi:hypothetical protein
MPVANQGTYDPARYVAANPATWPQPAPPATLYQPGMAWSSIGTGNVAGHPAVPGDLIFAVHRPRLYGDKAYGDGQYGSPPGQDWTDDDVTFAVWVAGLPPDVRPPFPYSGCPFTRSGWRIVVDAMFVHDYNARRYGDQAYGFGVYGGTVPTSATWNDITPPFTSLEFDVGNDDGAPVVDVEHLNMTVYDPDGTWFDPATWPRAGADVGDPIRVGLFDPVYRYWPLWVGEIEQIVDDHGETPRFVTVHAYSHRMDLGRMLVGWQRPRENASTRFLAILAAAGWRFGLAGLTFPDDSTLAADVDPRDVTATAELDRTALSAGWLFDVDRWGAPRLRTWPLTPIDPRLVVADCPGGGRVGATVLVYERDQSQLLNTATMTDAQKPAVEVTSSDPYSIALYGVRNRAIGFPATGLAFTDQTVPARVTAAATALLAGALSHVTIGADTLIDPAWLPALAALDTGRHLTIDRSEQIAPYASTAIAVGWSATITPADGPADGRIVADITTQPRGD